MDRFSDHINFNLVGDKLACCQKTRKTHSSCGALIKATRAVCVYHQQLIHEAGGSPAASPFFLLRQKKGTKEKATRVRRPAKARGSLRYSKRQAAAELLGQIIFSELCKQCGVLVRQFLRNAPVASALLGDSHGAFLLLSWSLR